jgi:hypothetical protein
MGRYLDIARRLSEGQAAYQRGEGVFLGTGGETSEKSEKTSEQHRLLAAGWEPRVRCGKTIWASPQSKFWYSEEMALEVLRLDEGLP